jgi:hypothetical protein
MLHELKALIGSTVTASDGETGSIRTFFFDDQSWKVSYLVVDAMCCYPLPRSMSPTGQTKPVPLN